MPGNVTGDRKSGIELFDFRRFRSALVAGRWTVGLAVFASLLASVGYLLMTAPTFRSDSLLHVQDPSGLSLPGMEMLREFSGDPTGTAETEIQIIKSRSVTGETVSKLNLTTEVEHRYFPLIGYPIARFRTVSSDADVQPRDEDDGNWISNYLWSRAGVRIDRFIVPKHLYGESFILRALGVDDYVLFGPDGKKVLSGTVGEVSSGQDAAGNPIEIFVREISPSGFPSDYSLASRHWLQAVSDLQGRISVTELGRDSRIIKISLEGRDPEQITDVVNSIAETYLRQNVEAQSQQAGRRLEILERQLPEIRDAVDDAELRLNKYREENLALDLGVEARGLLEQVIEVERQKSEFQLKRAELSQTYTPEHPFLLAIDEQMHSLDMAKRALEVEIEALPDAQREMLILTRDVGVNTALYMEFLNNAQELRLMESGAVGNIRIIDKAVVPVEAVKPQVLLVLIAAFILGLMIGIAVIAVRLLSVE